MEELSHEPLQLSFPFSCAASLITNLYNCFFEMDTCWESGLAGSNKNTASYGYNVTNYIFFFGPGCSNSTDSSG